MGGDKENTRGLPLTHKNTQRPGTTPKYKASQRAEPRYTPRELAAVRSTSSVVNKNVDSGPSSKTVEAAQNYIRTTGSLREVPDSEKAKAMHMAITNPEGAKTYLNKLLGIGKTPVAEVASAKTQVIEKQGPPASPGQLKTAQLEDKRKAVIAGLGTLQERAQNAGDASTVSRIDGLVEQAKASITPDRLDSIASIGAGIYTSTPVSRQSAVAAAPAPQAQPQIKEEIAAEFDKAPMSTVIPKDKWMVKESAAPEMARLSDTVTAGTLEKKPEEKPPEATAPMMDLTPVEVVSQDVGQLPCRKEFRGCADCSRHPANLKAAADQSSKLTGCKADDILALALADKGKCSGSCIRKVGSDYRVVSNKTGKLWPQKYGTREKAQGALAAYHISR